MYGLIQDEKIDGKDLTDDNVRKICHPIHSSEVNSHFLCYGAVCLQKQTSQFESS